VKRNALSSKEVAGAKVGEYLDGAGLCLVVTTFSKSWVQRYSSSGKRSSVTLGKYPAMSLSEARVAGQKVRDTVAKGIPAKVALTETGSVTFADAIQLWLPTYSSKVEEKTKDDALRRLELHASDIMFMSITMIKPLHIVRAMDKLVTKGQFETITKVTDNIKQVMEHVRIMGLIEYNPAIGLKAVFPQHQVKSFAALPASELPRIFAAMHTGTMTKQTRDLMVFQILSGLRCAEVVAAKWSGIDGDVITIEAKYMKGKLFKKEDHDVFLSPIAKEILERQPKKSVFIFPFRGDPSRHANSETITKWLRENGFKGQLVAHGFRSMFSTWANSQKQQDGVTRLYAKEIIELCISHKQSNVQTIYDRNEYAAERRQVMHGWSQFVKSCWINSLADTGI
jgi:integrase